jgi:hypothetical protein
MTHRPSPVGPPTLSESRRAPFRLGLIALLFLAAGVVAVAASWWLGRRHREVNRVQVAELVFPRLPAGEGDRVLLEAGHPPDDLGPWNTRPWPGEVLLCPFAGPARSQGLVIDRSSWNPDKEKGSVTDRWVPGPPGYQALSYRVERDGFLGHAFRLNRSGLERAWQEVGPTHLALLVRADGKGMTERFKVEIKKGRDRFEHYLTPEQRIGPRWSWLLLDLASFPRLPGNGRGLTEVVFTYEGNEVTQPHGGFHLARLSFVNVKVWKPLLPPTEAGCLPAVQPAAPGGAGPADPVPPPEGVTFEARWVLADYRRSAEGGHFTVRQGSWQSDPKRCASTDRWADRRLQLTYEVSEEGALAGHYFQIDGAKLAKVVGEERPTHLLLRVRSSGAVRDFRVEIKQPGPCPYVLEPGKRKEEAIGPGWKTILLPLGGFKGFDPGKLRNVTEVVTVFAGNPDGKNEGILDVAQIALVRVRLGG